MIESVLRADKNGRTESSSEASVARLSWPVWLLCGLMMGNLLMKRSFAHWGVPPLYIAEIVLLTLLLFRPDVIIQPWAQRLFRDGPLSVLAYSAVAFVLYGMLQLLRGIGDPNRMSALQNFFFNVYVVYLFAGLWLGQKHPELMRKLMYALSWAMGIYGILYLGILADRSQLEDLTTAPVATFGQPGGAAIAILSLLAFEKSWRRISIPLLLNACTLLGNQVRAEWLALAAALFVFAWLTGQFSRLLPPVLVVAGILLIGLITDVRVPAPNARGGEISTRAIVARAVAAIDERAAAQISDDADFYAATISWRTSWWRNILESIHSSPYSTLFGHGYAFALWELHPEPLTKIRTPHNIGMFCLAYGGWIGFLVFYFLQLQLGLCLYRAFRLTGNAFGICLWIAFIVWAPFDNLLEAPYGAIPFYLMCGMQLAPLLSLGQDSNWNLSRETQFQRIVPCV